jgi:hypothetical protein
VDPCERGIYLIHRTTTVSLSCNESRNDCKYWITINYPLVETQLYRLPSFAPEVSYIQHVQGRGDDRHNKQMETKRVSSVHSSVSRRKFNFSLDLDCFIPLILYRMDKVDHCIASQYKPSPPLFPIPNPFNCCSQLEISLAPYLYVFELFHTPYTYMTLTMG